MGQQIGAHSYGTTLRGNKEERAVGTHRPLDQSQKHCADQKKPNRKGAQEKL